MGAEDKISQALISLTEVLRQQTQLLQQIQSSSTRGSTSSASSARTEIVLPDVSRAVRNFFWDRIVNRSGSLAYAS